MAKQEFLDIYNKYIKREGADKLLAWLESTNFFVDPASTKFHSNYAGGLVDHSVKVYKRYLNLIKNEYGDKYQNTLSDESIAVIALLHDLCKANTYINDFRNIKKDGQWIKVPYFSVEDTLPYGHGEKSVYIICGFMKLSREEAMAINWHMGGFDARVKGGSYALSSAYYQYPTALLFNIADMQASYLDEETIK